MQKKKEKRWLTHGTVLVHLVVHCIFSLFASKPFNIYYLLFYNAFALMIQRLYSNSIQSYNSFLNIILECNACLEIKTIHFFLQNS